MKSCELGNVVSLCHLLQLKADPNIESWHISGEISAIDETTIEPLYYLRNALKIACSRNNHQITKLLLIAGANIDFASNKDKTTVTKTCVTRGRQGNNIDWNGTANYGFLDGDTALFYASRYRHVEILQLLIAAGANVNGINCVGNTALHYACTFEISLEDEGAQHSQQLSHKEVVIAKSLIVSGANVNHTSKCGRNAIIEACNSCHPSADLVDVLLAAKANVNCVDGVGLNCLMYLTFNIFDVEFIPDVVAIAQSLLRAGVNINQLDNAGRSAFLISALHPGHANAEISVILITTGVSVNQVDINGRNALILLCARKQNLDCNFALRLINAGINVNHLDDTGRNALMYVVENKIVMYNQHESEDSEYTSDDEVEANLMAASMKSSQIQLVALLIDAGINIRHETPTGCTALNIARESELSEIVKALTAKIDEEESKNL